MNIPAYQMVLLVTVHLELLDPMSPNSLILAMKVLRSEVGLI